MKFKTLVIFVCVAELSWCMPGRCAGEDISSALKAFLEHRVGVEHRDIGMVIGLVDEQGSQVISLGKLDNGTDQNIDGDTVFEIGSITKTFTGLLLQDMIDRGEMKLEDPVAEYLPKSVNVPSFKGKKITLLDLATHTSGLPDEAGNLEPKRAENRRADYTEEKLDAFVSGYSLKREPGTKYEYSTVGMALLGQAIAHKAGQSYESLVADRICRPLGMNSTGISLGPDAQRRFATGHNFFGYAGSHTDWAALAPGAALRSNGNDMLKYLAANLGLTHGDLAQQIEATHAIRFHAHHDTETGVETDIGLGWMITHRPGDSIIFQHGGLTQGFMSFVCFDPARRRGVVVLCNSQDYDVSGIGLLVLETPWRSNQRPMELKASSQDESSYVGQYQSSPKVAGAPAEWNIGIRQDGDRLFLEILGPRTWPVHVSLPPVDDELRLQSASSAFLRLSGVTISFSRDSKGKIIGFSGRYLDTDFAYNKISDEPPTAPEPLRPRIAIHLANDLLDACVGQYVFAPDETYPSGMKLAIYREGNQLLGQASGQNASKGTFDVYPASSTEFFVAVDGEQLIFLKNERGETSAVVQRFPGAKQRTGQKVH